MIRSAKGLWLLHLAGNAALLWLVYVWLGVGDATRAQLLTTVVLGSAIVFFALWLHGAAFAYFRGSTSLKTALRSAIRHMPRFLLWCVALSLVYWIISYLESKTSDPSVNMASWLTLHLGRPVRPSLFQTLFALFFGILRWFVIPAIVLPQAWRPHLLPHRRFWLECPLLLLLGFYAPFKLIHWVPPLHGLAIESLSLVLRFVAAYLLSVTMWLALVFVTSGGKPRETQPSTTALP